MYVDYFGIRVTNLAKSVRFFEKGLGLTELRRGKMGHGGIWVLMQDTLSHQQLELNWYPRRSKYYAEFVPGEGLDHLGIRVNDLARAGRKLRNAGAKLVEEIRWRGQVVLAYYEGPDGIWVELIHSPGE